MTPGDDFLDDFGWDDEPLARRERRRKARDKKRFGRQEGEGEIAKPRKNFERRPRRDLEWVEDYLDED